MIPSLFFLIALVLISLQSHFIFGGDSAEYATIAKTWGIAHPPGYPLYSLLANIVNSVIPFGTTPWRVALLSSIPTVLTAYCIYKILCMVRVYRYIAFATSLFYIFLFPIWQYALIPEVFALHTLFVSLITYLLLAFTQKNNKSLLLWASLLCGLSISNHHIFILFIPGWLYLLKDKMRQIYTNKQLLTSMLLLCILGASFYLYAIIASFQNTVLDWENAKTIDGLFRLITRSSYGTFKAYSGSSANVVNQLSNMFSGLVFIFLDFKVLGMLFIGMGLYAAHKYSKLFSIFMYISLILHFVFLFYTNFVLTNSFGEGMFERFLIPLYIVLLFFLGIGVDYCYKQYYLPVVNIVKNIYLRTAAKAGYYIFLCVFLALLILQNYKTISLIPSLTVFDQLGKDIINTVPYKGIVTTQGDSSTFAIYYYLYGLKQRTDMVFIQMGLMGKQNHIEMLTKRSPSLLISAPLKKGDDFMQFVERNKIRGFFADRELGFGTWRPYGLLWKYYTDDISASSESALLMAHNKRLWEKTYKIPVLSKEGKNIFHLHTVGEYYIAAYKNYAKLLITMDRPREAEIVLKNIAKRYKKNDLQSEAEYMNLLVSEKKCPLALQVAKKIDFEHTIQNHPGFVKSALFYLQTCDPKNEMIPTYKKQLLEQEKKVKTDLNFF